MSRVIRRLLFVGFIGTVATLMGVQPASAQSAGAAALTGDGTISPGLTTTPTDQDVSFGGNIVGAGVLNASSAVTFDVDCNFSGGGDNETEAAALDGDVSGSCSGTGTLNGTNVSAGANCSNLEYDRVAAAVLVTGSCTISVGTQSGTTSVVGGFVFVPTSVQPVQSYLLAGAVVLEDLAGVPQPCSAGVIPPAVCDLA